MYRVDNREFIAGEQILPQGRYQNNLNENRARVEQILEEVRPADKPRRNEILMVFENFDHAKRHWIIQQKAKLYKVRINEDEVLHRGDYNKVEELFRSMDDPVRAAEIATEYWAGNMTANPKPEIFVPHTVVTHVLSDSDRERQNAWVIFNGSDPIPRVRIVNDVE